MANKYEDSTTGKISQGTEKASNLLSRLLQTASEYVAGASIQKVQVFALRNTRGTTSQHDFTPKFEVQGITTDGELSITGRYPVQANNGAGELGLEKSYTMQLNGYEAKALLDSLESGAKIENCMSFSGWQKDGKPFQAAYARGAELETLNPKFAVVGARGNTDKTTLAGMFNYMGAAPDLDRDTLKENLKTFVEAEREKYRAMLKGPQMPTFSP